jgi:hypothetical protein
VSHGCDRTIMPFGKLSVTHGAKPWITLLALDTLTVTETSPWLQRVSMAAAPLIIGDLPAN